MKEKENFTPCAMRCTQEQWEKQLKPILELIEGVEITDIYDFDVYPFIVNNYRGNSLSICNLGEIQINKHGRTVLPKFDLCKFLQLSGINVVIQGNIEKRKEIKQWWEDRMGEESWMGFDANHLFYGIVGGDYSCYYYIELPEGTQIINPFKIVAYAPDTVVGHFYSKNDGENNAVGYLVEPGKDLGAHGKHSIGITEPGKAEGKNTFMPNYNSPKTFPRYMYGSDKPMDANNKGLYRYAIGVIGHKIWFVKDEDSYNKVQDGEATGVATFKYIREIDETLPKGKYTIDQLIEKAGLNKDDIEII